MKYQITDGQVQILESGSPEGIYIDGILKDNLDGCKRVIKKDWDYIFVVDGEVGSGKSVFAQQVAYYASDGKLSLSYVCFTPDEFKEAIKAAPKYSAVIFDEAFRGLSARAAMTAVNRSIIEMLNEIRQKNLFVFILIPSIWDIDPYVRLHRCKGVFNVYTVGERERGYFRFYKNTNFFKQFFSKNDNRYKYPPFDEFHGRFIDGYVVDNDAYKQKKKDALYTTDNSKPSTLIDGKKIKRNLLCEIDARIMEKFPSMSQNMRAYLLGIGHNTLNLLEISAPGAANIPTNLENPQELGLE